MNSMLSPRPLCAAAVLILGLLVQTVDAGEQADDHSRHDMSQMSTVRDAEGRSLYGMKHKMDPAMTKELRDKVALYKNYSDAEITLSMDMMGAEYAWYISPPELRGAQGILILMHGFREQGDRNFKEQVQPIGDIFPTSMGVGMAMMMSNHIQVALDQLRAAGAKEVVVVPITSSGTNELYRQWLYIFGKQDKPEFASVPRVKTDAKLHFVAPPGDNPLVGEILLDHAAELSKDPKNEVVIIAGHGPTSAEDNAEELRVLSGLAKIIKQDGGFADVVYIGDLGGQLWKWDLSSVGVPVSGVVPNSNWPAGVVFEAPVATTAGGVLHYHSIFQSTAAAFNQGDLWLSFASGERANAAT